VRDTFSSEKSVPICGGRLSGRRRLGVLVEQNPAFATRSPSVQARSSGPSITPEEPEALAAGPDESLYIVDTGRDEVLQRLPDGRFVVVAGDGKTGYSSDGVPAADARLALDTDSGIAVGINGIVYIADSGNDRIRAVLPNGTIETVAGGGNIALSTTKPVPARDASLTEPNGSVAGMTIGPDDELYFAINSGVYRLAPNGDIYWVVGKDEPLPKNYSWDGNPAVQNDFSTRTVSPSTAGVISMSPAAEVCTASTRRPSAVLSGSSPSSAQEARSACSRRAQTDR